MQQRIAWWVCRCLPDLRCTEGADGARIAIWFLIALLMVACLTLTRYRVGEDGP